jgi:membrane protease YdiL (CAAX protease family)
MNDRTPPTAADWLVLGFALLLPTAITWLYFIALDGAPAWQQQGAYAVGKAIQFVLPVVWLLGVRRQYRPLFGRPSRWSLAIGGLFGTVVGVTIIVVYRTALQDVALFDAAASAVRAKVQSFGAGTPARFVALAVFYSAIHSLLEEYYWRWFVFGELARGCKLPAAIAVSSVAFAAHHVLVVGHYFTWLSIWTWLFTLAVIIGGAFWAWLFHASRSLVATWLSHGFIDAAIFAVGYLMIAA